jgi:hypothetical protein
MQNARQWKLSGGMLSGYFVNKFFHQLRLDFLNLQEPLPLVHEKVIYFLVKMANFQFCL